MANILIQPVLRPCWQLLLRLTFVTLKFHLNNDNDLRCHFVFTLATMAAVQSTAGKFIPYSNCLIIYIHICIVKKRLPST